MQRFDRMTRIITNGLGAVLLLGVFLNFLNVLLRYLFGNPFAWSEEVMVFGLLLIVMGGTVLATLTDRHLKIDLLVKALHPDRQYIFRILTSAIWVLVSAYLATQSFKVVILLHRLGQTSIAARIPTWIPHSFVLVAFVLSTIAGLVAIARAFRRLPISDQSGGIPE